MSNESPDLDHEQLARMVGELEEQNDALRIVLEERQAQLAAARADVERLTKRVSRLRYVPAACPCLHTTPCHKDCSCVNPKSQRGCERCCSHGGINLQRAQAERLAGIRDDASRWINETDRLVIDNARLRDENARLTAELAGVKTDNITGPWWVSFEQMLSQEQLDAIGLSEDRGATACITRLASAYVYAEQEAERQETAFHQSLRAQIDARGEADRLRAALAQVGERVRAAAVAVLDKEAKRLEASHNASSSAYQFGYMDGHTQAGTLISRLDLAAIVAASAETTDEQPAQDSPVFDYCKTDEIRRIIESLRSTYDLATNEYAEKKNRKQMAKILVEELGQALKEIETILEGETRGKR